MELIEEVQVGLRKLIVFVGHVKGVVLLLVGDFSQDFEIVWIFNLAIHLFDLDSQDGRFSFQSKEVVNHDQLISVQEWTYSHVI